MSKFYTTESAAAYLGVTPARVRQLILEERLLSEKYGRDHYYMGPECDTKAGEGIYWVRVFNGTNRGRYALAIGKREKFTFFSLVGAIVRARSLDRWFFK